MTPRIFLLSPAHAGGKRASYLANPAAAFPLAVRLRREMVPLGEVFSFLSGLYFRGKSAYAKTFARAPLDHCGAWVITTHQGLVPLDTPIDLPTLAAFARTPIDEATSAYREPLEATAARLRDSLPPSTEYVLLGSIATGKYVEILGAIFGPQLLFPTDFVGRGDMSRGALLLRRAASGEELDYRPVSGAARRGARAPRISPPLPS